MAYLQREESSTENLEYSPRIVLREQEQNIVEDFILKDFGRFLTVNDDFLNKSSARRNLFQNTNVILRKLNNVANQLDNFFKFLWDNVYLIKVTTDDSKNAIRIFSVMNNRGLDLSPTDLIKSDLLSKIKDSSKADKKSDVWELWEEKVKRENFSRLFNFICMIYKEDRVREELYSEFQKISPRIGSDVEQVFQEIESFSEAYAKIQHCQYDSKNSNKINDYLTWLNRIPNTDWMPVALLACKSPTIKEAVLEELLRNMEILAAYLMLKGENVNGRMKRYIPAIQLVKTTNDFQKVADNLKLTATERSKFLEMLAGDIYTLPYQAAKYILLRLDSLISDQQGSNYDPKVLTIEHVLPQTVDPNSEWMTTWSDESIRNQWIHKIGNLVPLNKRRNSAAQNFDFQRKKNEYFQGNTRVTSYAWTTKVINKQTWTKEDVKERQEEAIQVFETKWLG